MQWPYAESAQLDKEEIVEQIANDDVRSKNEARQQRYSGWQIVKFVFALVASSIFLASCFGGLFVYAVLNHDSKPAHQVTAAEVERVAFASVKKHLWNSDGASFKCIHIKEVGPIRYRIYGTVDAKKVLSDQMEHKCFIVDIQYSGNGEWDELGDPYFTDHLFDGHSIDTPW